MELNENEKIDSWVVAVLTSEGRVFTLDEIGIGLPDSITQPIDEMIEDKYPVTWQD